MAATGGRVKGEPRVMRSESELLEAILAAATVREDGRQLMACPRAFELAEQLGVEVSEIGRLCNREGIKIAQCQLGCFP